MPTPGTTGPSEEDDIEDSSSVTDPADREPPIEPMLDPLDPPENIALWAAVFEGGLALLALGLGWLAGSPPLRTLTWSTGDAVLAVGATLPLLVMLWCCVRWPVGPLGELVRVVEQLLVPIFREMRLAELAIIALLAGLGEEMLFRGVIQQAIADAIGSGAGPWIALAAASLLFGLSHSITASYAVLAGLIGLYLGGLWMFTGNLLVPVIIHALYDFLALVYLVKMRVDKTPLAE